MYLGAGRNYCSNDFVSVPNSLLQSFFSPGVHTAKKSDTYPILYSPFDHASQKKQEENQSHQRQRRKYHPSVFVGFRLQKDCYRSFFGRRMDPRDCHDSGYWCSLVGWMSCSLSRGLIFHIAEIEVRIASSTLTMGKRKELWVQTNLQPSRRISECRWWRWQPFFLRFTERNGDWCWVGVGSVWSMKDSR